MEIREIIHTFAEQLDNKSQTIKKNKTMSKTLNYLVEAVQATEYTLLDVQRKFRRQVYDLISVLQEGVGYVAFNDETSFPRFTDYNSDETYDIVAVKVKYDTDHSATLLVCIDAEQIEESEGWFVARVWGDCDIQDIFDCVKGVWEKSNE